MKIIIAGSMQFSDKMIEVKQQLQNLGNDVIIDRFIENYAGKSDAEIEIAKNHDRMNDSAAKKFWADMIDREAILVLNFDRHGVTNYIGGNTLIDMSFAHFLNQKIFLWNPIPEIPYYKKEIESFKPTIIHGDLTKIK